MGWGGGSGTVCFRKLTVTIDGLSFLPVSIRFQTFLPPRIPTTGWAFGGVEEPLLPYFWGPHCHRPKSRETTFGTQKKSKWVHSSAKQTCK